EPSGRKMRRSLQTKCLTLGCGGRILRPMGESTQLSRDTDEALAGCVARRSEGYRLAFDLLYDHYAPRLLPYLFAKGVPRDYVSDVHQEVWLRVWALKPDSLPVNFCAWLFTVAKNCTIDRS